MDIKTIGEVYEEIKKELETAKSKKEAKKKALEIAEDL
jgi:hypothetical protein